MLKAGGVSTVQVEGRAGMEMRRQAGTSVWRKLGVCEQRGRKHHPSRPVLSVSSSRKTFLASGCAPAPKATTDLMPVRLPHSGLQDPVWPQTTSIPTGFHSPPSAPATHLQAFAPGMASTWKASPPSSSPIQSLSTLLSSTQMPPFQDTVLKPSF